MLKINSVGQEFIQNMVWMAYLSSMKSGSLSGDISKGQGLESSGGFFTSISATWAGVTERLGSVGTEPLTIDHYRSIEAPVMDFLYSLGLSQHGI